jgi:hypothetical protein
MSRVCIVPEGVFDQGGGPGLDISNQCKVTRAKMSRQLQTNVDWDRRLDPIVQTRAVNSAKHQCRFKVLIERQNHCLDVECHGWH